MGLRPHRDTQKILISTTSRLVGEYEHEGLLLTHAWPFLDRFVGHHLSEGPASRHAFIVAFETEPEEEDPRQRVRLRPNYTAGGNVICGYLAVLFGKRFDNHGAIENDGRFYLPDLRPYSWPCDPSLPQNSHRPRVDFPTPSPLNLSEVARIGPLLSDPALDSFRTVFQAASKFYLQALQNAEQDPEVAYLHLITAGEVLAGYHHYDKRCLLDQRVKQYLDRIEREMEGGAQVVRFCLGQTHLVRQEFVRTICGLIDDSFFDRSESVQPWGRLKAESFGNAVRAAYDLRSRYVHTGVPFGSWVSWNHQMNEVPLGQPVVEDKGYRKVLANAPTYIGLERVIRYCLLRFAQQHGAYREPGDG